MNLRQHMLLTLLLMVFAIQAPLAQCSDCAVLSSDGINSDDGTPADGVQTSRNCGCGVVISGACATVQVDLRLNPYFDPNDPNCQLIINTQEQGNFSIYFADENCSVSNCASPDFVISSGQGITNFPRSGVFTLMVCKNGGNAGRRDISFSISCSTIENCVNLIDDNRNSFIDCDDADCSLATNCSFSATTSGNEGGLESNDRLVEKIARRNYLRAKTNTLDLEVQRPENLFTLADSRQLITESFDNQIRLPEYMPVNAIEGATAYVSSPTDLIEITNAREVFSVDMFQADKRIASVFSTRSEGGVYEHTKFICDRLNGASIKQIWEHPIDGKHPFLVTKFTRSSGITEYACNFSFFRTDAGQFQLESHWNTAAYTPGREYGNFQIWANNMANLESIVKEVLLLIQEKGQIIAYNFTGAPQLFVSKVTYRQGKVDLDIINKSGAKQLDLRGELTAAETAKVQPIQQLIPLSGSPEERISLQTKGVYNMGLTLREGQGSVADGVYVADGAWGIDFPIGGAMIYDYEVTPNHFSGQPGGYAIERNVAVKGTVQEYVALYRALNPAFRPVDVSGFNTLRFTARGTGDLEIIIVREGVQDWNKQMKTAIKLTDERQEVVLPMSRFFAAGQMADWSDVKMLVFSLAGDRQQVRSFNLEISDVSFQWEESPATFYLQEGFQSAIFPNPMITEASVLFRAQVPQHYTFQLLTPTGVILQQIEGQTTAGINELRVKNDNYLPGVYFYHILLASGEVMGGKVIIPGAM